MFVANHNATRIFSNASSVRVFFGAVLRFGPLELKGLASGEETQEGCVVVSRSWRMCIAVDAVAIACVLMIAFLVDLRERVRGRFGPMLCLPVFFAGVTVCYIASSILAGITATQQICGELGQSLRSDLLWIFRVRHCPSDCS